MNSTQLKNGRMLIRKEQLMARICVIGTRGIPSFVGGIETICENLYPRLVESQSKFEVVLLSRLSYKNMERYIFKGVISKSSKKR